MEFKQACVRKVIDKLLVLEENKRKCLFLNPNRRPLTEVLVDGCQIVEGAKCDYLVIDHCGNEYFVELKGKDLPHAIEQLEKAIVQLSDKKNMGKKYAIIVASRHPANDTSIQRAKVAFRKKYKVELISKNILFEMLID